MSKQWKTIQEIARDRSITVDEAQKLVQREHCPATFHGAVTLYLV